MTITCSICKKKFKYQSYLERHLKRKYPCKPVENDKTFQKHSKNAKNIPKTFQKHSKNIPKTFQNEDTVNTSNMSCVYCFKNFSTQNALYKHINCLRCKKIPEDKILLLKRKLKNKEIKKKITFDNQIVLKLDSAFDTDNSKGNKYNDNHQGSNNTGNNNVNSYNNITNNINNTINIKINPFGEEDLSFISKEEKLRILNKQYMGVPELIKLVHEHPCNRNMFLPNVNKKIMAYLNTNNELQYDKYDDLCEKLVEKNVNRLDTFFEEVQSELNEGIKNRLEKVISKNNIGENDEKYIKDLKLYLINIAKRNKKEINNYIDCLIEKIENRK